MIFFCPMSISLHPFAFSPAFWWFSSIVSLILSCVNLFLQTKALIYHQREQDEAGQSALREAYLKAHETEFATFGPLVLGAIAKNTSDADTRRHTLSEGRRLLARGGGIAHNHLWFHRDAIDAYLGMNNWGQALESAAALEYFTRTEPLAWSDFYVRRARVLARHYRDGASEETANEIHTLIGIAEGSGLNSALPALREVATQLAPT